MELVTGRSGKPHITSQQVRQLQQGIFGANACILNTGSMLTPEVQSSNKIRIKDGALMFQGALFTVKVGGYDEVTINNGNQGMKRKDVIAVKYTYDSSRNIESGEWAVVQGTPAASNPAVPSMPVTDGDIQAGDAEVYCPVFVINLDGINVTGVDIIPPMMDDMSTINKDLSELSAYEKITLKDGVHLTRYGKLRMLSLVNASSPTAGDIVRLPSEDTPSNYVMSAASLRGQTRGDFFISITPADANPPGKVGIFIGNNEAQVVSGGYIVACVTWCV